MVYDSYIPCCHGYISTLLAGVRLTLEYADVRSSIVSKCFSLCADDFLECSCIPKPIASAGESASLPKWLSLASAQRCWQCIWRRLVLYPTLYPGLVEHWPDMTFRVEYVGRHWLLPVCDQEAEAKWLCPGTYSALYAMCSKRARKPWPGWCFQYWPGHIKSPAQSSYTVYDTKSQHVVATTTVSIMWTIAWWEMVVAI